MVDFAPDGELLARYATTTPEGVRHLATGAFDEADIGIACYHSKTGAVELYLNHLLDGPGEYVVVDMTAGADAFASGLFTRFDLTVLVCEPTRRGVGVYAQYAELASGHGVALRVLGNKVVDADDAAFLRDEVGDALLGCVGQSRWVPDLEPGNLAAFDALLAALDERPRDWAAYHRRTVEFHLRNAAAWANRAIGVDLAAQVDASFVPQHAWAPPTNAAHAVPIG
ncbi:hypothetical protein ACU61A_24990 [Pseudonocardia sichuanensis]|uniref:hypothetical protein n=1 Tax=Pseudonocardia kunmingensis TaxID=630975 RepID=UPI003CCC80A0